MKVTNLLSTRATISLEHVLDFTHDRQKVLSDNAANIDTPGYRANDLAVEEFNKTIGRAIERSRRRDPNISVLDLPAIEKLGPSSANNPDAAGLRGILFHDHNDRSVEELMVAMTRNNNRHAQASTLLRSQVRLLRAIIAENAGAT